MQATTSPGESVSNGDATTRELGASGPGPGRRRRFGRPSFATVLVLVPAAFLVVIYAVPVASMLAKSFTYPEFGLQNYQEALTDPVIRQVLWITVRITLETVAVCLLIGYPLAVVLSRLSGRWAMILTLVVIAPLWTSVLVRSFAWIVVLGNKGPVVGILHAIGIDVGSIIYTEPAVVIAMSQVLLPFMVLSLKGSLDRIDISLIRAARTLGAGPARAFFKVYFPLSWPGTVSGMLVIFVLSLGFFVTPALVGGSRDTMVAVLIEQQVNSTFQWGLAAALAVMLLLISAIVFALSRRLTNAKWLEV